MEMENVIPIKSRKNQPLIDAILANESLYGTPHYKSGPTLANEFLCTPELVWRYRAYLKAKGLLKGLRQRTDSTETSRPGSHGGGPISAEEMSALLDNEPIPSELDRLKAMARLLRVGSPQVKIAAFKALEEATRGRGERVGPPAPLTHDERIARGMRLMMAMGKLDVDLAYFAAFGETPSQEPEAQVRTDDSPVREAPEPSEAPLPDLPETLAPGSGPLPQDG